ncbi:MAG: hypothetical protein OQL16_05990, partial [Gammaproteobacteria bacterium]|nr:hypothetical protein [Gammaproteobacteria bacterium]
GYYVGTLGTVTAYAEAVAVDLNERDINMKFSTVPLARYQPHSTRQKITLTNPAPQESPGKA